MRILNHIPDYLPTITKTHTEGLALAPLTNIRFGLVAEDGYGATVSLLIDPQANPGEPPLVIVFPDRHPWHAIPEVAIERNELSAGGNENIIGRFCKANAQLLAPHVEVFFEREPDSTVMNVRIEIHGYTSECEVPLNEVPNIEQYLVPTLFDGESPSVVH